MKWKVEESFHDAPIYIVVDEESGDAVCDTDHKKISQLIAAAPELLQQLGLALAELEDAWDQAGSQGAWQREQRCFLKQSVETTIAKAKG